MTLNFSPTAFTSGTTMSSSAVNANFTAMQQQSAWFSGTWVARNNTSIGLNATDYVYAPLSANVIRLSPPLTSPDRGIVLSALKSGAVSDRVGMDAYTGKFLSGAMRDGNNEHYSWYDVITGIGSGAFNLKNMPQIIYTGFWLNMGTTNGTGGSAASIGYDTFTYTQSSPAIPAENPNPILNVYAGAGVPWICVIWGAL